MPMHLYLGDGRNRFTGMSLISAVSKTKFSGCNSLLVQKVRLHALLQPPQPRDGFSIEIPRTPAQHPTKVVAEVAITDPVASVLLEPLDPEELWLSLYMQCVCAATPHCASVCWRVYNHI